MNAQHFVFCILWFVIVVAGVFGCHHFCGWKWHRGNGNVNANNVASGSSKTEFQCKYCARYFIIQSSISILLVPMA